MTIESDSPTEIPSPRKLKVLIADDNPAFCSVTEGLLRELGLEAQSTGNGAEAIAAVQRVRPDLLICDLFMPEKDGLDVLRELPRLPHCPKVVSMSGCVLGNRSWVEGAALKLGAASFLKKPFGLGELRKLITELFPDVSIKPQHTVLIVEDDEGLRALLRGILEEAGYHVLEAQDGLDGMVTSRMISPDVIVTDLMMPELNGMDLLQDAKQYFPNVPVVVMSGAFAVDAKRGMAAMKEGATALLGKPFSPDDLVHAVQQAISKCGVGLP